MKAIHVLVLDTVMDRGGAETMIMNIFRNIDRSRFRFDFYLSGNSGGFYEEEVLLLGGRIINVGRRKKHPVKYSIELFKLIRKEKYDVIQIHATDAMDGLPAFISWLAGAKKICLFSHNTRGQSMRRQKIMRAMFMPFVTHPQACSDMAAEWMFGKRANKTKTIPLPINCDLCVYDQEFREKERLRLGLTGKKVVGHIGRFQTQKNHEQLIDIFDELIKKDSGYRLVLIGAGNLEESIRKKVKKLEIEEYVLFMGQVDKACRMLSIFDVFLLPSLYEGFPTVLLEAQANGLESVVSSTITPSIALTDLVHFVKLDDSASHWADQLIEYTCERHDTEKFNMLIAKDYSAPSVAAKFSNIYLGD